MSFLWNLFLPHHENNHKAHLIRSSSIFIMSFLFVLIQVSLNFFMLAKPAVLGFSSNISPEKIIELTNQERNKLGLGLVKENKLLSEAARQKAADMFAFNYWAHVSPSGRTPWTFFIDAGYKYQFAGENLARDFVDNESVVKAWMQSPSHKENVVNYRYQEIGVAVVQGTLQGVETTLVVQLFGTPYGTAVSSPKQTKEAVKEENLPTMNNQPVKIISTKEVLSKQTADYLPLTSPLNLTKSLVILIVGILIGVFALDALIIHHDHSNRFSSRSLAQMLFLLFVLFASIMLKQGAVL